MNVLVVLPTYNEAENIDRVLRRIRASLEGASVLVVDDGSPDGTADTAEVLGKELGNIEVLRRHRKSGLGSAYRAGFRWGLERGFDACIEMDADLSHEPEALPGLVAALSDGCEVAVGSRYVPGGVIPNWAWHRRLLSRGGNVYASALLGLGVADSTSGFRAYSASVLRRIELDRIRADGYGFQIEMTYRGQAGRGHGGGGAHPLRRPGRRRVEDVHGHRGRGTGAGHLVGPAPDGGTAAGPDGAGPERGTTAMTGQGRILVVDDEPYITDVVTAALRFEGFTTEEAATGTDAMEKARTGRCDLIVLDVMLPDIDGFEVCERLRAEHVETPVLFLTARDATVDKLAGLARGDDYVTKPFSIDELVARIRAVLRRSGPDDFPDEGKLRFSDLVVDVGTHEVWRGDHPIDLTATEFKLLHFLLRNARQVLSKPQILDAVWDEGFVGDSNIVEIYISYLRKKVDCYDPPLIHTIRRVGYSLREPRP